MQTEHFMALFRGWYPHWLAEMRSWNSTEDFLALGLLFGALMTIRTVWMGYR